MKIISAITPKGGGGKTSLLFCLSKAFHDTGLKVLVLDPDTNMSMTKMYERRIDFMEDEHDMELAFPDVQAFQPSSTKLARQIQDLGKGYDVVVVDTYGHIERYHNELIYLSDLVLIPTQPNQSAIDNALNTCEYLETVRSENEGLPVYGVAMLNFSKNGVEEREYRRHFEDAYVFSVETRPYAAPYKFADRRGLAVNELDKLPMLSKKEIKSVTNAAIEMRRLCKEIINVVDEL